MFRVLFAGTLFREGVGKGLCPDWLWLLLLILDIGIVDFRGQKYFKTCMEAQWSQKHKEEDHIRLLCIVWRDTIKAMRVYSA